MQRLSMQLTLVPDTQHDKARRGDTPDQASSPQWEIGVGLAHIGQIRSSNVLRSQRVEHATITKK